MRAGVGRMKLDEVSKGVLPLMLAEFIVKFALLAFPSLVNGPAKWFAS
jgi:TRAP-type C4-dicarboxylate transport system permease large subunit